MQLINADCLKAIDKLIEQGAEVDAIITDPPYNISRTNNFKTMKRTGIDFGEWDKNADILSWIEKASTILKINGNFVMFNDWKNLGDIVEICEKHCLCVKKCLVFKKTNPAPFNRDRVNVNDVEFALWAVKGKKNTKGVLKTKNWTFNRQKPLESCVFEYVVESGGGFKKYHPTQKSTKQMTNLLEIYTNQNDIVLDPFMGSGTTGVACKKLNRRFMGIEIDESYFNIAKDRIAQAQKDKERSFFM